MSEEPVARAMSRRETLTARLPEGAVPVITAFIASRLMVCGVIVLSRLQVPPGPFASRGGLLSVLNSGDAARYLQLAQTGPSASPMLADPANAFFPVFPFLLKVGSALFGDVAFVGVVIANLCLLAAGMLLYRLVRIDYPGDLRISRVALMLLMFSPASYFFTCALPDSTALLLAIASLLAARRNKWLVAAACALLLCGTINVGLWIIIPLAFEYVSLRRNPDPGHERPSLAWAPLLALVSIPLAAALVFGHTRLHDAWALLRVSRGSEATLAGLLRMSHYFDAYAAFYRWVFGGALVAAGLLCIAAYALRVRASYWIFALVLMAVCLWSHDLQVIRTLGLAFPLSVIMAALVARFDAVYEPFLTCSMTVLALCTIVAANGFWVS